MNIYVLDKTQRDQFVGVSTLSKLTEMLGFQPELRNGNCSCKTHDCLCRLDPFTTARIRNVKLDIGDKHDIWKYLFVPEVILATHRLKEKL